MFALAQLRKLAITEQIYIVWPFYDCSVVRCSTGT